MSYDQGNQGSRRNYNDDANYAGGAQGTDDSRLSGAYGGSGTGQAGGYTGSHSRGNNYAETDPGMAGNRGVQDTQSSNVPGAGRMRGEQEAGSYDQNISSQGRTSSRGYERDNDEYGDYSATSQGRGAPKPSLGSKVLGEMEKMAGKATGKPELEAKGEQRQSGF